MVNIHLDNVSVPEGVEEAFKQAQKTVERYFEREERHPKRGTIEVEDERYLLIRAESLSVDFFRSLTTLYPSIDRNELQSLGHQLLFELAFNLGQSDAKRFHQSMDVENPIQKLSTGPVHFAYSGWARVNILDDSNPTPDENYFLHYKHPNSFEADSWLNSNEKASEPICYMNAGYSSGWCTESFGIDLVSVEVQCRGRGDSDCEFIMAPADSIEERLEEYDEQFPHEGERRIPSAPDFIQTGELVQTIQEQEDEIEDLARLHGENPNPVLRFKSDGELLYLNEGAKKHWAEVGLTEGQNMDEPFDEWIRTTWEKKESIKREWQIDDRWYQLDIVPLPEANYINVYAVEITEQKKAEEALEDSLEGKELLIEELHHRIKNNLQLASSLINLQADDVDDVSVKSILHQSESRLKTMSMIHEKLSQAEEKDELELNNYLKSTVNDIVEMYSWENPIQVTYDLDPCTVESDLAVPCGLVVNELVVNAIEHGITNTESGRIRIKLKKSNHSLVLSVADNGQNQPGEIDMNDPDNLGLSLVATMVRAQLNGDFSLKVNDWTEFLVRFDV